VSATLEPDFSTLFALREAHSALLERQGSERNQEGFLSDVRTFVARSQATGRRLDRYEDRALAQTILDYWSTVFHREAKGDWADRLLAKFDPGLSAEPIRAESPYQIPNWARSEAAREFLDRDVELALWLKKLHSEGLLVIAGGSGSGRHSVLHGGLLHRLRDDALPHSKRWRYVTVSLDSSPIAQLDQVFPRQGDSQEEHDGRPTLFVIESGEMLITNTEQRDRNSFVQRVVGLLSQAQEYRVILVVLEEYVNQLGALPAWEGRFEKALVRVAKFSAAELRAIIVPPAERVGLKFDEGLVDELISDVAGDSAALVRLLFTLRHLWTDRKHAGRITWDDYRNLGSVQRAYETVAERFYEGLKADERLFVQKLFQQLLVPGPGTSVRRNRLPKAALEALYSGGEGLRERALVEEMDKLGLIRWDEERTLVSVAHVALATTWPKLMAWIDQARVRDHERDTLRKNAIYWREHGREPSALLRGKQLNVVVTKYRGVDLDEYEREYIAVSEHLDSKKRRARWAVAAGLLAVVLSMALWRFMHEQRLTGQLLAERGERLLEGADPAGAALWFDEAVDKGLPFGAKHHLRKLRFESAFRQMPHLESEWPQDRVSMSDADATSSRLVTASVERKSAMLWLIKDGKNESKSLETHSSVHSVALYPSIDAARTTNQHEWDAGQFRLVTGEGEIGEGKGYVRFYEPDTGRKLRAGEKSVEFEVKGTPTSLAFSLDGKLLAVGCRRSISGEKEKTDSPLQRGAVYVFDAEKFAIVKSDVSFEHPVNQVAFDRTNGWLAIACGDLQNGTDGAAALWDFWNSEVHEPLTGRSQYERHPPVSSVVFDPDGKRLLEGSGSAMSDGEVRVWNVANRNVILGPIRHAAAVNQVKFSPDGTTFVVAGADQTARVVDSRTGQEIAVLPHEGWVFGAAYSPDGRLIATGARDRKARVWDFRRGRLAMPVLPHPGSVSTVAFSADGDRLFVSGHDSVRLWEVAQPADQSPLFASSQSAELVAPSAGSDRLLIAYSRRTSEDDPTPLWEAGVWNFAGSKVGDKPFFAGEAVDADHNAPRIVRAVISDDGKLAAIATESAPRKFKSGETTYRLIVFTPEQAESPVGQWDLSGSPHVLALSRSEPKRVLAACRETIGDKIWWCTIDGKTERRVSVDFTVNRAAFVTLNGSEVTLAAGGSDDGLRGTAQAWDVDAEESPGIAAPIGAKMSHDGSMTAFAVCADKQLIATASTDDSAKIWRFPNPGQPLKHVRHIHTADLTSVAISKNGRWLATGARDRTAAVVDWEKWPGDANSAGKDAMWAPPGLGGGITLVDLPGMVNHIEFSDEPDPPLFVTISQDGIVRVWDRESARLVTQLPRDGFAISVGFRENGKKITTLALAAPDRWRPEPLTGVGSGKMRLHEWSLEPVAFARDKLGAWAKLVSTRELSGHGHRLRNLDGRVLHQLADGASDYGGKNKDLTAAEWHLRQSQLALADSDWYAYWWHAQRADAAPTADQLLNQAKKLLLQRHLGEADWIYGLALQIFGEEETPEAIKANVGQIRTRLAQGRLTEAKEAARKLIAGVGRADVDSHMLQAEVHLDDRDLTQTIAVLKKAVDLSRNSQPEPLQRLAAAQLAVGDKGYQETAEQIQKTLDGQLDANTPSSVARWIWPLVLSNKSGISVDRYEEILTNDLQKSSKRDDYWSLNTLGATLFRVGKYKEAIKKLEESCKSYVRRKMDDRDDPENLSGQFSYGRPQDWLFLAMAHWKLEAPEVASGWLEMARTSIHAGQNGTGMDPSAESQRWRRLDLEILEKEAAELIESNSPVQSSTTPVL
jgi:WD40 repeat protein/tetratricopeptide (TPR) repeat protein